MIGFAVIVPGTPVGQGRLSYVGRGRVVHSNAKLLKPWREKVAAKIRQAMGTDGDWPILGPVKVAITFTLPRPKSAPRRMWPAVRPDIDHLGRAALDALTMSGAIKDDAQVVMLGLTKVCGSPPGMCLTLRSMAGDRVSTA